MIDKSQSIKIYLNAHLKKKWTIFHDTENGRHWIVDVKNKYWIVEVDTKNGYGHCWYQHKVIKDISELYDIDSSFVESFILSWLKDILNRDILSIYPVVDSLTDIIEKIIAHGTIISIRIND